MAVELWFISSECLDAIAYFFFLGAESEDAAIVALASSAFIVTGVLLWLFLKGKADFLTGCMAKGLTGVPVRHGNCWILWWHAFRL